MGRDGAKKPKPIPVAPRGVGQKSYPILAPPPLRGYRVEKTHADRQNCHIYFSF